jgi:hypothetical protein
VTPNQFLQRLVGLSSYFRYAALYRNGELEAVERAGLAHTSSPESDKYEELFINPTLITLIQQRGEVDCGGAEYLLVRYGRFFQFVQPIDGGHLSVSIEKDADPMALIAEIREALSQVGL